jgi:hypothetical protein
MCVYMICGQRCTHARAHTCTRTRTHAHTHTRTHMCTHAHARTRRSHWRSYRTCTPWADYTHASSQRLLATCRRRTIHTKRRQMRTRPAEQALPRRDAPCTTPAQGIRCTRKNDPRHAQKTPNTRATGLGACAHNTNSHNPSRQQDLLSPFWYQIRMTGPGSYQSVLSQGECWYVTHALGAQFRAGV